MYERNLQPGANLTQYQHYQIAGQIHIVVSYVTELPRLLQHRKGGKPINFCKYKRPRIILNTHMNTNSIINDEEEEASMLHLYRPLASFSHQITSYLIGLS